MKGQAVVTPRDLGPDFVWDSSSKSYGIIHKINSTGWIAVPPKYLPPVLDLPNTKAYIRRTDTTWEFYIVVKDNVSSTSWSVSPSSIPSIWLPEFDLQLVLQANNGQVGRIWIRPGAGGQIVYTGASLTGAYEPSGYVNFGTDKPMPTGVLQ